MPHDKNGSLLAKGDEVILRGVVSEITSESGTCNVRIKDETGEAYTLTASKLEKVGKSDTQEAAEQGHNTQHTDSERYPKNPK